MKNNVDKKKGNERIEWLDAIRGIAIMLVVLCHVSDQIYFNSGINIAERHIISEIIGFTLNTLGRLGVPFFLFISGYLLLTRVYDERRCQYFWRNNLLNLFLVTETWIVLYNIFNVIILQKDFSWQVLIRNIFFLKATDMSHVWYLPMILGLYLTLPFVAIAIQKVKIKTLLFPFSVMCIYYFGVPTLNVLFAFLEKEKVSNQLTLSFGGGMCGIYLLVGYFSQKKVFDFIKDRYLLLGSVGLLFGTVWIQSFGYHHNVYYRVWYDFGLLFVASIFIFELLKRRKVLNRYSKIWYMLSEYSFGIYLIHNPILISLIKMKFMGEINTVVRVIILCLVTLIGSWLSVWALSKIPRVGRQLFLIKEKAE